MSKKEAEELMIYVDSSRYESETEIEKTERLIRQAAIEITSLKEHLVTLRKERTLDLLDKLGDRAVIRFTKKYGGGMTYHYAAIKSGRWWFITSDGLEYKRTTESLKQFIGDGSVEIMAPDKEL